MGQTGGGPLMSRTQPFGAMLGRPMSSYQNLCLACDCVQLHEGGSTYFNLPGGMAQAVDMAGEVRCRWSWHVHVCHARW